MAVTIPPPAPRIIPLAGDQITVGLRNLPGSQTEVIWHVARNGTREEKFSLTELADVLRVSQQLLNQARSRQLNTPQPGQPT